MGATALVGNVCIRLSGVGCVVLAVALVVASVAAAPAAEPGTDQPLQVAAAESPLDNDTGDPLEPMNRVIFEFNEVFQALVLRPMAELYAGFVPPVMREAIGNVLDNLSAPVVLANDILQWEPERAWQTTRRIAINTTVGLGGLWDPADRLFDIPEHDEDFGQTLGVWGVGEGVYVVLPFLGPSSPRDAIGRFVIDMYFDPVNLWADNTDRDGIFWGRLGAGAVHKYAGIMDELDQTRKTSIDYYATIRSIYRQKREADIRNGEDLGSSAHPRPGPGYHLENGRRRRQGTGARPPRSSGLSRQRRPGAAFPPETRPRGRRLAAPWCGHVITRLFCKFT